MRNRLGLTKFVAVIVCLSWIVQLGYAANLSKTDKARRKVASQKLGRVEIADRKAIALYSDRLEFFNLEEGIAIGPKGEFKVGESTRSPGALEPSKIVWFARPLTMKSRPTSANILACTAHWASTTRSGGTDNFCGIISSQGEILYQFPFKQHPPDSIMHPIGISEDG